MKGSLFDTCICVFLFRQKFDIDKKLNKMGYAKWFISEITIAELKYGAYKSNRMTDNLRLIDAFVEKVNIVSFLKLLIFMPVKRTVWISKDPPVEDFDFLIASAAYCRGLTLVTDNVKNFKNIKDLEIENWVVR